jgi:hypothetical protein
MIDAASAHHDHFSNFFESRGLLDGRNNTNFLVEACFIMSRFTTQYGIVLQSNITARLNCKHEQLMQYLRRVNSCDGSAATSAQHYEWTNESFVPISAAVYSSSTFSSSAADNLVAFASRMEETQQNDATSCSPTTTRRNYCVPSLYLNIMVNLQGLGRISYSIL